MWQLTVKIMKLPEYKVTFPKWKAVPLTTVVTDLDSKCQDLLEKMLQYN